MRKYIITLTPTAISPDIDGFRNIVVEKTKFNTVPHGIEIFITINEKERKLIIPWHQISLIEEVNE